MERSSTRLLINYGKGRAQKYRYGYEKVTFKDSIGQRGPFRTEKQRRIKKAIRIAHKTNDKRLLPLADGRKVSYGKDKKNSCNAFALDIDKLPPQYSSFRELEEYLLSFFKNKAVVSVGSFSGKAKLIFLALNHGKSLTKNQVMEYFRRNLPEDIIPYIDTRGLFLFYIHSKECIYRLNQLKHLPIIQDVPRKEEVNYFKYYEFSGELSDEIRNLIDENKLNESFVRILLGMRNLIKDGFCISTKVLSRQLKITPRTASVWLKKAIKLNILDCIDAEFEKWVKPKKYKATEYFSKFFIRSKAKPNNLQIPETIEEGKWHESLLKYLKNFRGSERDAIKLFSQVPGFKLKDREKQLVSILKWYKKIPTLEGKFKPLFEPSQPKKINTITSYVEKLTESEVKSIYKEYFVSQALKQSLFKNKLNRKKKIPPSNMESQIETGSILVLPKAKKNWEMEIFGDID